MRPLTLLFEGSFRERRVGANLVLLMTLLIYLATVMASLAVGFGGIAWVGERTIQSRATLVIPPASLGSDGSTSDTLPRVFALLKADPSLAPPRVVTTDESRRLLQAWGVDSATLADAPLPILMDLEAVPGARLDLPRLKQTLVAAKITARLDSLADTLATFLPLLRGLSIAALGVVGLVLIVLALGIAFACRSVLTTQRDTLEMLHLMGADDKTLTRLFRAEIRKRAFVAAGVGFVLAAATLAMGAMGARTFLDISFLHPTQDEILVAAGLMALVPVLAVFVACAAARRMAMGQLRAWP